MSDKNIENCGCCGKDFNLDESESKTIVGESGIDRPVEMEVDVTICPHCGAQGIYD